MKASKRLISLFLCIFSILFIISRDANLIHAEIYTIGTTSENRKASSKTTVPFKLSESENPGTAGQGAENSESAEEGTGDTGTSGQGTEGQDTGNPETTEEGIEGQQAGDPGTGDTGTSDQGTAGQDTGNPEVSEEGTGEQGAEDPETAQDQDNKDEQEEAEDNKTEYAGEIKLINKVSIKQGEDYKLKVTLTEDNLTGEEVTYQSSNKKIITVSQKGIIKAVHWGEAKVTVSLGKAKTICNVTVNEDVTITISAAGDCTLSSDIKQPESINFFSVYNKQKDDAYFFKNVKPIFEKDDMTIVNFEGTLSSHGKRADKTWAFRGLPSYIDILTQGSIEAVAFANNHVRDYGEISYSDTISCFEKSDIIYSSYSTVGIYEVKGIKIGMISIQEHGVSKSDYIATLRKAFKTMEKKNPDLLIVSFHWGIERTSKPTQTQIELSRMAIDEGGADLVLGHHPHVLQPIEKYKDSYIVYSLGNFCFGGNTNPPDKDTMIYQQIFTFHNDKLVPDDNVRIIPCFVSSISSRNDYQPTPGKGSEKERILQKINKYCKPYGISFDESGKIMKKK